MLISNPSQIFLMVEMVVLLFRPQVILFMVDCVTPEMVANLLIVMLCLSHKSLIRCLTASPIRKKSPQKNTMSSVLTVIAWITFIGGFISGIVLARDSYSHTDAVFSFTVALTYWAVSFISGIFILGFAEIIKLLNDIKNKESA